MQQEAMKDLQSQDKKAQDRAFNTLMQATHDPVDWAYALWDDLVRLLSRGDNRQRAIASQVLCNLAKSDAEERMLTDFDALLAVTRDEKFVTARHCLQSLWKVGISGDRQRARVLAGLEQRYRACVSEKNSTLIRYDILQNFKHIFEHSQDASVKAKALELINEEADPKYRKKYASIWKGSQQMKQDKPA